MTREIADANQCFWDSLDVHSLRVLDALLTERNVSQAARRLNQSQPAVSSVLRRLRQLTGDPLLLRAKTGMVPTERALAMIARVRLALAEIESIVVPEATFDPAQTRRIFNVTTPDYVSASLLAKVVARVRTLAPKSRIVFHTLASFEDFQRALEVGKLDAVIGHWPKPPENLRMLPLFRDNVSCLMRRGHPLSTSELTLEQYLRAEHLAPTPDSLGRRDIIDARLARSRHKRQVVAYVPYFTLVPQVLLETNLIFTGPGSFVDQLAQVYPLHATAVPIAFPRIGVHLLWHNRTHHAADSKWFRDQLITILRARHSAGELPNRR